MTINCYKICIPNTHRDYFWYQNANEMRLPIGSRVWVSFRNQRRVGLVIEEDFFVEPPVKNLKPIISLIDNNSLLPLEILNLCQWVGSYYQSPLSEVIALALPKNLRQGKVEDELCEDYFKLLSPLSKGLSLLSQSAHKQRALLQLLNLHPQGLSKKEILKQKFQMNQIQALLDHGAITTFKQKTILDSNSLKPQIINLNEEQQNAVAQISQHLDHFHCFLLYGVTGSGKTEVYLEVIEQVLLQDQQVLVLVPEIGLTPQLLKRFSLRFSHPMVVIHSNLSEGERQKAWQSAKDGQVRLVIGTRTAIFTPFFSLGLIILDEEHDLSYKQQEGVRYCARDTALIRAYRAQIPIVLGSATPSIESLYNVQKNKYSMLQLNQKALNNFPLSYQILDIRNLPLKEGLAEPTLTQIEKHLNAKQQVLVFINRRGFSPVLLCHHCGWMANCKHCDTHLTFHRNHAKLICHHCGYKKPIPLGCEMCQSRELIPIGSGTERIFDFLKQQFPHHAMLRIDKDEVQKKDSLRQCLEKIEHQEVQLIVGTQMLSKGHHFPNLSLVVILDGDAGFFNSDFRAMERLGQQLIQVSGRAGRGFEKGHIIFQTHFPNHPQLNLLIQHDYQLFANSLLTMREKTSLPPYSFLALIRAQNKTEIKVLKFLHQIREWLSNKKLILLGPAPAPLPKKANQYRMQLLIKSHSRKILQTALTAMDEWIRINKLTNDVRYTIDVDPMDLS